MEICYDDYITKVTERCDCMSAELLTAVLWIPFGIVALIAGLIYCISGYKKGLWRALGSLGAVVLSTVVSVLASRLLAGMAAPALTGLLPVEDSGELGAATVQVLLVGLVSVALAMVLFGVLMLIVTPAVSKLVGKLLGNRLTDVTMGLKWAGMATGLVSALVFALFWLSPVYGTLATAVPVAQSVLSMQQAEEEYDAQIDAYIDSVSEHLLVQVSGTGPVSMVYDGISKVPVGGASVSVVDMSKAINEAVELLAQIKQEQNPEAITQISQRLIQLTRENFVDQDWFYDLSQELVAKAEESAANSQAEDTKYMNDLLGLAKMPKGEFQDVLGNLLDFSTFALGKGALTINEQSDPAALLESGLFQEMGKVLNSSQRMVGLKKMLMALILQETGMKYNEAMAFLEQFQIGALTDPQEQLLETEAMLLPGLSRKIPPVMLILRHPSLGEAALEEAEKTLSFAALMGYPGSEEDLKLSAKEQKALMTALKKAAKLPFEEAAKVDTGLGNVMSNAVSADMVMPN